MDEKQFSLSARCAKIKFLSVARHLLASLFLGSALGIISNSACADPAGVDMGPSPVWGGGGNNTPPTRDYEAERRQQEADAAAARQRQTLTEATTANEQGVQFYKDSDWAKAVAAFQKAADKDPDDTVIKQNLANAQANLRSQQAEILAKQQEKESAARMHKSIENLAESLTVAPTTSGGLDFDGGNAPAATGGSRSRGLDFTAAIATPSSPLEFGDPKVVDTRKVPSGLPKSVEATIPHTPAGDRVRKGFQAIAGHDWKVALAWFQDALNKEPDDPGLQRLVDLAQFTLDHRSPEQTAQSPAQNTTVISTDNAPAKSGDPIAKPRNDIFARAAANQMASRARAEAAYKKYKDEHGDHADYLAHATAVQKASRGEGYSKEELDAQFLIALSEYSKSPKSHADSVGGSAAADETSLGGSDKSP